MEINSTQQEILLLIGTKFSSRYRFEKDNDTKIPLTEREQLAEACWNGLLQDMLPEICEKSYGELYLWDIRETNSFIEIELGEVPVERENYSSIDPYSFLPTYFFS